MNERNHELNNKGLSLVELIVAISIGTIVSAAVVALISFAINMYRNETAELSAQYELQTNVNQIMDSIMGANFLAIQKKEAGSTLICDTHYAAFGSCNGTAFDGVIFVAGPENPAGTGRFNIYMGRDTWDKGTNVLDAVKKGVEDIEADMGSANSQYLLGEGSTQFRIEPKKEQTPAVPAYPYINISADGYINPLSIEVELNFQKDATGRKVDKHVKDEAYLRNRVSKPIYIHGTEYKLIKK